MIEITEKDIKAIAPFAKTVGIYLSGINTTMKQFQIDSVLRAAMFLAQLAHESGSFKYVKEIASGNAYEGRKDLGNKQPGDGVRFKGRGLIQITGRANYEACGKALGVDFIANPELLETPPYAALSAGWFWNRAKLNALADTGNVLAVTKKINGGTNGLDSRQEFYKRAILVLHEHHTA